MDYREYVADLVDSLWGETPLRTYGDDRELYCGLAQVADPILPVLELAVGTGRVARFLAERRIPVVGIDISPGMLKRARKHIERLPDAARELIMVREGDMRNFDLGREFSLVIIPFSAFQELLSIEEQTKALQCIRRHLVDGGHLVIDVFDPKLEWCVPRVCPKESAKDAIHVETSRPWKIFVDSRENIPEEQILRTEWRFVELDEDGRILNQYYWTLRMRWIYRFEMQHLLERNGFEIVALWSDYQRSPFTYGKRQVWLARKV